MEGDNYHGRESGPWSGCRSSRDQSAVREKLPDDFQKQNSTRTWICRLDRGKAKSEQQLDSYWPFMEVNMSKIAQIIKRHVTKED